jgi:hypothetical protein
MVKPLEPMEFHIRLDGKFAQMVRDIQDEYSVTRPAAARMLIAKGYDLMKSKGMIENA